MKNKIIKIIHMLGMTATQFTVMCAITWIFIPYFSTPVFWGIVSMFGLALAETVLQNEY